MPTRTKWAIAATVALVILAIGSAAHKINDDNPDISPAMVQSFARNMTLVAFAIFAIVWTAWYWAGKQR